MRPKGLTIGFSVPQLMRLNSIDAGDPVVERWPILVLGVWVFWLSVEYLVLGPYSYVWVHDFGDSLVPQALGESGADISVLFGGWDSSLAGGVDKATYIAGQFKLMKFAFDVLPGWLAFGLFGVIQRFIAGYFTYRVIVDVFECRPGVALAAGMIAAVGLQPASEMKLAGFMYNLGLGVSLLPFLIWLHWRLSETRPWIFAALIFFAGALISLTTAQVFAWPVLICFGLWVLAWSPLRMWGSAFFALFMLGLGYGLLELPNVLAMLADLPESHRVFTPLESTSGQIKSATSTLLYLALQLIVPFAAISASIYLGGSRVIPKSLMIMFFGCLSLMALEPALSIVFTEPGGLASFQFRRIVYVLPLGAILITGAALGLVPATVDGSRLFGREGASVVSILTVALVLWAVGQSLWIKFQGLRYYGHGSNFEVLFENPVLKRVAGLKDDRNAFRVATLSIEGVTHLQRSGNPWAYGLETADGYMSIYPRRYQELWVQAVAPAAEKSPYYYNYLRNTGTRLFLTAKATDCSSIRLSDFANIDLISLLNIRFIVSPCPLQDSKLTLFAETREGPGQAWHRLSKIDKFLSIFKGDFPSKELFVYENPFVLPRYFLTSTAKMYPSRAKTLAALGEASRQTLRTTAMVTADDTGGLTLPTEAADAGGRAGSVTVISVEPNEIRVQVDADRDSILVIANSYNPRWAAMVNGDSRKIFPVDHAFQGLTVNKGRSEVVLKYTSVVRQILNER